MNLSQKGLELIKRFEGLRLVAYKVLPTEKYYTIGYGHYGSDVRQAQRISEQEAENLLKQDVTSFVKGVNDLVKITVNQNQFDSLVSFAYNVGLGAFGKSTLLDKLNKGDFIGVSNEFPRWNKSGGKVLQGLVNRRNVERELFDTPIPVVKPVTPVVTKTINNIKVLGNIQVDGVKNFTYIYDQTSDQSKRLGEAKRNQVFPIAGSVKDWYEVIYQNRRAYIKAKYCSRI